MKHKINGLLLLLCLLCTSATMTVKADIEQDAATTAQAVVEETTTAVSETQVITADKTVKVNKSFKSRKILNLKNKQLKDYTFTTANFGIATVSDTGVVKGLKKGSTVITVTSKADGSVFAQINVKVKNRYTKSKLRLMSSIIYSEAGGECYAGKKAVGIVIMNRISSSQFPNTLKGVIYQSGQFTPATNGSLNSSLAMYDNGTLDRKCIKAAKAALNGDTYVTYKGDTINMTGYLYFSGYLNQSRLKIQGHHFK